MENSRGFSIITNFGCYRDCFYCIWKGHKLENIKQKTDWNKLGKALSKADNIDKISVSGGGDPLYNLSGNIEWYKKLFNLCRERDILVDIHTSEITYSLFILRNINRYVLHTDKVLFEYQKDIISDLSKHTKFRINFVITNEYTCEDLAKYIRFARSIGIQIAFRELVGDFDKPSEDVVHMLNKVHEIYNQAMYIRQDDYNLYYMPDNKIYEKFLI